MILWSSVDTDSAMTEAKTCFGLPPFLSLPLILVLMHLLPSGGKT